MKKIEVQGGGYPGTSKTFRQLRDISYQVGQLAANLAGNAIVNGLEVSKNKAKAGMIVLDGELYPCEGGTVKD